MGRPGFRAAASQRCCLQPDSNIPLFQLFYLRVIFADFSLKRPNFLVGHGALAPVVCDDPVFRERKAPGRLGAKGSPHND